MSKINSVAWVINVLMQLHGAGIIQSVAWVISMLMQLHEAGITQVASGFSGTVA